MRNVARENGVVGGKNHSSFVSASFELPYTLLITSFKIVLQSQEDVALLHNTSHY